ncbi:9756_t:CDS:2 [Rhizophagus irregularis]|nr:9756_t:CDS:2 [Rhizophagus irregularis]
MFDIVQHKNIGLELEIAKYKRLTEDLNKKFNEVNNNYQKNINGWKELYYYQVGVSEELKEKYYKKIGDAEEWKKKYYEEFIKKNLHIAKNEKYKYHTCTKAKNLDIVRNFYNNPDILQ